jgi:protein-tyrosine phosphatase
MDIEPHEGTNEYVGLRLRIRAVFLRSRFDHHLARVWTILALVSFGVLYICTGNVSRSPMAEYLLRASAAPSADLEISSAGMAALAGDPMDRPAAAVLEWLGIDPSGHRARQFDVSMAARADLVLTAERAHREQISAMLPTAFRRVFTIKEFARLAPLLTERDPRIAVAEAAAKRAAVARPHDPHADDVADPYLRETVHTTAAAEEITAAMKATLDALGFAQPPVPARRPMPFPR